MENIFLKILKYLLGGEVPVGRIFHKGEVIVVM